MTVAAQAPIGSLKAHPKNPRKGNVAAIADSLKVNGQYKPILVNKGTLTGRPNEILAGTHTWKAAKSLGWGTVGATFVDVDDDEALAILLSDNKASDSAFTDETAALALLSALPDLAGTGYDVADLNLPALPTAPEEDEPAPAPSGDAPAEQTAKTERTEIPIWVGSARGMIEKGAYDEWRAGYPKRNPEAFAKVCEELGLVEPEPAPTPSQTPLLDVQEEYINSLVPYPGNPQQGDVGLLTTLLKRHGQTRPVVANRNTRRVLAGHHVIKAAQKLGWDRVVVSWLTCDEEAERRIVLVDNRTADLAEYDAAALGRALTALPMAGLTESTGYTLEDVEALLQGETPAKPATRAEATIRIGTIKGKVRLGLLQDINLTPGYELEEVAAILRLEGLK
jgi:ParB-like chromosome segregation protein Spo0J